MAGQEARREARAEAAAAKARVKAQRPWYQKKRYILPLGFLALIIVVSFATSGGDNEGVPTGEGDSAVGAAGSDDSDGVDGQAEQAASVGESVSDGQFTFTVNSVECGATSVGEEPLTEQAQGQLCLMNLRVENTGDQAQSLFADNQYLYDAEERQYSASFQATLANDIGGDSLFTEINPGNSIEGTIVFDVPQGASVVRAELHDSAFSNGIAVNLQG